MLILDSINLTLLKIRGKLLLSYANYLLEIDTTLAIIKQTKNYQPANKMKNYIPYKNYLKSYQSLLSAKLPSCYHYQSLLSACKVTKISANEKYWIQKHDCKVTSRYYLPAHIHKSIDLKMHKNILNALEKKPNSTSQLLSINPFSS